MRFQFISSFLHTFHDLRARLVENPGHPGAVPVSMFESLGHHDGIGGAGLHTQIAEGAHAQVVNMLVDGLKWDMGIDKDKYLACGDG